MSLEITDTKKLLRARDAGLEWQRYLQSSWSRRHEEWKDNYRNFSNIYFKRFYNGRAKIFVPLSFQLVESFIPAMVRGVFATNPHFSLMPVDLERFFTAPEAKDVVDNVRALLHFEQQKKIKIFRKTVDFARNMCIYGRGIMKGYWRHETQIRNLKTIDRMRIEGIIRTMRNDAQVISYDGADFVNLDPFSTWVDPEAPDSDIQRAGCVMEQRMVTTDHLRRMTKTIGIDGKPIFEGIPDDILSGDDTNEAGREVADAENDRLQLNEEQGKHTGLLPSGATRHELLEFWWDYPVVDRSRVDANATMVLLNRKWVIRLNRNPFYHGQKPHISAALYPKPNEFDAQGLLDPARRLQFELNDTRNQAMDWKTRALSPTFLADATANLQTQSLRFGPGAVNKVGNVNGIKEVTLQNILPIAFAIEQQIERDMRGASGALPQLQGLQGASATTASEAISMLQQANARLDLIVKEMEEMYTIPQVEMQFELNKQFARTPRVVRSIEEVRSGVARFGQQLIVPPYQLVGTMDFFAMGSSKMQIEALKSRQLLDFFGIVSRLPPVPANMQLLNGLIRKIWEETFGFRANEFDAMMGGQQAMPGQGSQIPDNMPGGSGATGMGDVAQMMGQTGRDGTEMMQQGAGGPF